MCGDDNYVLMSAVLEGTNMLMLQEGIEEQVSKFAKDMENIGIWDRLNFGIWNVEPI